MKHMQDERATSWESDSSGVPASNIEDKCKKNISNADKWSVLGWVMALNIFKQNL